MTLSGGEERRSTRSAVDRQYDSKYGITTERYAAFPGENHRRRGSLILK
jgi:hypothetical protein